MIYPLLTFISLLFQIILTEPHQTHNRYHLLIAYIPCIVLLSEVALFSRTQPSLSRRLRSVDNRFI